MHILLGQYNLLHESSTEARFGAYNAQATTFDVEAERPELHGSFAHALATGVATAAVAGFTDCIGLSCETFP